MGLQILKKGNRKCAICAGAIAEPSPADDLCAGCFRICVQTGAVLRYLQNTSIANLNSIQQAAPSFGAETIKAEPTAPAETEDKADREEPAFSQLKIPQYYIIRRKTGERFLLSKQINKIGKSEELSDISVSDNGTLSRCHAALEKTAAGILIWDCGSKNGTKVGTTRLTPNQKVPLQSGDVFRLANEEFILTDAE